MSQTVDYLGRTTDLVPIWFDIVVTSVPLIGKGQENLNE